MLTVTTCHPQLSMPPPTALLGALAFNCYDQAAHPA